MFSRLSLKDLILLKKQTYRSLQEHSRKYTLCKAHLCVLYHVLCLWLAASHCSLFNMECLSLFHISFSSLSFSSHHLSCMQKGTVVHFSSLCPTQDFVHITVLTITCHIVFKHVCPPFLLACESCQDTDWMVVCGGENTHFGIRIDMITDLALLNYLLTVKFRYQISQYQLGQVTVSFFRVNLVFSFIK